MNARMRILTGPMTGQVFPINSARFLIGREEDCQLRLQSAFVSRHHCALMLHDYTLRIRDLGSKNGTHINGRRIGLCEMILLHDDVVAIGELTFVIDLGQSPDGQDQAPVASPAMEGTGVFEGETQKSDGPPVVPPLTQNDSATRPVT